MDVVALISGGKDSCFNAVHCVANGHRILALANLHPDPSVSGDEIDSFMYQTVGHAIVPLLADCFYNPINHDRPLPMFRRAIRNGHATPAAALSYSDDDRDSQVDDLFLLLSDVMESIPTITAVSVGAILSNYQRIRVEFVCQRLNLTVLAYLWEFDQSDLLDSMIRHSMVSVLIKVAAMGLNGSHLGKSLAEMRPHLLHLHSKFDVNVCGEGGEYETLTLDCPLFRRRLAIQSSQIIEHAPDEYAPVLYLQCSRAVVEKKHDVIPSYETLSKHLALELCVPLPILTNVALDSDAHIAQPCLFRPSMSSLRLSPQIQYKAAGRLLAISAIRPRGTPASLKDAVLCVMTQASTIMHEKQLDICTDTIMVTVMVQSMDDFGEINAIYGQFFKTDPPARACIQANMDCYLQVDLLVRASPQISRTNLHVQSVSYWAPANIGPYSQAVSCGGQVSIAGQIGLVPQCMAFPQLSSPVDECVMQATLARRHLERICRAVKCDLYTNCVTTVAYVSNVQWMSIAKQVWGASNQNPPSGILIVVTVPKLPRNAMVEYISQLSVQEWQVPYLMDNERIDRPLDFDEDANVISHYDSALLGDIRTTYSPDQAYSLETRGLRRGSCVSSLCSIFVHDANVLLDEVSILKYARSEISLFLATLHTDLTCAFMIRAFVVANKSQIEECNLALSHVFHDCCTSLVPVSAIYGGAKILISVHGSLEAHIQNK